MKRIQFATIVAAAALTLGAIPPPAHSASPLPDGWSFVGAGAEHYTATSEDHAIRVSSLTGDAIAGAFGSAMQIIAATHYAGKRLRLRADVRSAIVSGWAGLWMRIDGSSQGVLAFDNMQNRAIRGTTEWKAYDVTLPVDAKAADIAFGVLLSGSGDVWMRNVSLQVVPSDTALTGTPSLLPAEPNFAF